MKVLHVIDSLGRGGAETVLLTLLPSLRAQGCAVEVAVRRPPYDLEPELTALGIRVHRLPLLGKWALRRQARALAALAGRTGAQIVHAHLYFPAVTTALMRVLRLSPARCFVTFHNLAYAGANRGGAGLWLKKRLASWLYPRGFDGMFGVSQAVAQHYEQALGLAGVQVLPNPIDLPADPSTVVRATPPFRLVLPGRLVPEKGHADLIKALGLLDVPTQTTFCGGGPLQEVLAAQAPDIRITGPLNHAQMMQEIAQADLVIVPSRFEGFGLTALEAMALSRPVIASTAGGLPEVLGGAGVLVPPRDPQALAAAINDLLSDPDRRQTLGQAARQRAQTHFSASAIAGKLLEYYRQALSKEHP
ncbi:glycosyltransferase family 4 protein [Thalassovita sp.]|jgi:glycosyltransferase involved in cell wall biosynthesis|uniref:glycosyltransferase family 4 protein n=1 Tax=Thalassovita sp. TaxID=1979401 RepID=UPI003B58F2E9